MYRSIVARKVNATFKALSSGDAETLISQLAPNCSYRFVGNHALGGERTAAEDIAVWFDRVFRLFPHLRFDVVETTVKGFPWRTVVLTQVVVTDDDYRNDMFQRIDLSWGRITSIVTLEDLDVLQSHLASLAEAGNAEAVADPILSTAV